MRLGTLYTLNLHKVMDCKDIQPVHPKGDQSCVFTGRTDVEAETPILWPPDAKSLLFGKYPDAGKDWRQEEKGMKEDEMAGWHHGLDGCESEWTLGYGDGQGGLACWFMGSQRVKHGWATELNLLMNVEGSNIFGTWLGKSGIWMPENVPFWRKP